MTVRIRIRNFNPFAGPIDNIDYIAIKFPMEYDFDDMSTRREMYDKWRSTKHFPERFQEANDLLAAIEYICPIGNFAQGFSKEEGTYIILLIGKESANKKGVVRRLRDLIEKMI